MVVPWTKQQGSSQKDTRSGLIVVKRERGIPSTCVPCQKLTNNNRISVTW